MRRLKAKMTKKNKSEQLDHSIQQKVVRKVWQTVKNISKKRLNTDILNADRCLRHLCTLFSKDDKGLLPNEVQILDPDHADELKDGFTIQ